jgi:hypothetical protein
LYKLAILIDLLFNLPLKRQHSTPTMPRMRKNSYMLPIAIKQYTPSPFGKWGV